MGWSRHDLLCLLALSFVLLHWFYDGSLKPQRIWAFLHMYSHYRVVGIWCWGYRSAWLILSWRSAHLINFPCTHHESGTAARISLRFGVEDYVCMAAAWKGDGHGWMIFVRNMAILNICVSWITFKAGYLSVFWSELAGIWCGHLLKPCQCWTNTWSWFNDFEFVVLFHWFHDGSLKPQRIWAFLHMYSHYRVVGIWCWGYSSAWLISSWRSAHLVNFSIVHHKWS